MKKVAALVILLVGLFTSKAHDTHSSDLTEGWSTIQTLSKSSQNSSKPNAVNNKSVVVNWSLICEDLCGAGYGGSVCGKHCYRSQPNPFSVDNGKYDAINLCSVLCGFDLGGRKCSCPSKSNSRAPKNAKEFCYAMCKHYNISFDGCSPCSQDQSDSSRTDPPSTSHTTEPSDSKDSNSKEKESEAAPTTIKPPSSTKRTTERTTSKFTTISSTTPMDDSTRSSATTPDWHLLCKDLCKKGEGGLLCNCDLPPLTLKSN